jgi:hypothetical protein
MAREPCPLEELQHRMVEEKKSPRGTQEQLAGALAAMRKTRRVTLPLLPALHRLPDYADFLSCCWAAIQRCSNVMGLT